MGSWWDRLFIGFEQVMARTFEPLIFPVRPLGAHLPPVPPTAKRNPVILVHGVADSEIGSRTLATNLRRDGWTVFTPTMPGNGLYGIEQNAKWIGATVALVQALTGARMVDLVGHSQGGLGVRWYVSVDGGAKHVGRVVTINSPLNGVGGGFIKLQKFLNGLGIYGPLPPGLIELLHGSAMLKRVTSTKLAADGPKWTSLYSADHDGIIFPVDSPVLEGARNIALVQPARRLTTHDKRGPTHVDSNQKSEEAYAHLRDALVGPAQPVRA